MANTTNFNWETPDDTDLVKDGAAAIRTLGSSIDTSFVDLKGGTTGQILSKASNTDLDYTWITNDQGDITEVTVSSPLTGGGSSGSVNVAIQDGTTAQKGAVQLEDSTSSTSTTKAATPNSVKSSYDLANAAIPKSLVDAAGDLIYATADNTVARLAIGTAGKVLTVNSGATAPEWATPSAGGGFTLINTGGTTLSGNTTVSGIPGTHKHLLITIHDASASAGGNNLFLRMNGDTGSNYRYNWIRNITTTLAGDAGTTTALQIQSRVQSGTGFIDGVDAYIWIYNYTNTDYVFASWGGTSTDGSSTVVFNTGSGKYDCSAAISSITVGCADSLDNGTVYVYGVS